MQQRVPDSVRNQWKQRITSQGESGLSIATWCRQKNIHPHNFYYWRNKFFPKPPIKRDDFEEISSQNGNTRKQTSGVRIEHQGFHVLLDQQFDTTTLKKCLKALRELSC